MSKADTYKIKKKDYHGPLTYAALRKWKIDNAEDNSERLERLQRNLPKAMLKLTERQRQVLELHFTEQMNETEIGKLLGVNKSTVCRTLKRGMKKLREYMEFSL